ncbi:hypothetical protein Agub_g8155, partial [Astrephomene gubernaculifera]
LANMTKDAVMVVHVELPPYSQAAAAEGPAVYIDLWPNTSLTAVLELNASGRVNAVLEERTRPAGLLFGLPTQSLVGSMLSGLVTLPPGRSNPSELLSLHGAKKSSLKADNKEASVKVGPLHVLQGAHSDGRPLVLDVQVVGKPGPNQPVTAILRVHAAPMMPAGVAVFAPAPATSLLPAAASNSIPAPAQDSLALTRTMTHRSAVIADSRTSPQPLGMATSKRLGTPANRGIDNSGITGAVAAQGSWMAGPLRRQSEDELPQERLGHQLPSTPGAGPEGSGLTASAVEAIATVREKPEHSSHSAAMAAASAERRSTQGSQPITGLESPSGSLGAGVPDRADSISRYSKTV